MATYSNGYEYRKLLTIPSSQIGTGLTGEILQVLVQHTDTDLKSVANGGKVHKNPLVDIRFEDTSGNKLFHELMNYDPTTGDIRAWVQVPLTSGSNYTYYIYFGKDVAQESYNGIKWGLGSADSFAIARNWYNGGFNPGEAQVNAVNPKDVAGTTLDFDDGKSVALNDDTTAHRGNNPIYSTGIEGFIMYSAATTNSRFGQGTLFNQHLIGVFYESGQWWYDSNSSFGTFTPVSTDILVAKMRWNTGDTDTRSVDYVAPIYAGEMETDYVWGETPATYEKYGFGATGHNLRGVYHMNKQPRGGAYTYEGSEPSVFNNVTDASANISLVSGKVGNAYGFNGTDTYARMVRAAVISGATYTGQRTTSMWVKFNNTTATQCVVGRRSGTSDTQSYMWFLISGVLNIDLAGSGTRWTTGWAPSANTWYHVAVTIGSTVTRLYVNGAQVASVGVGGNPGTSDNEVWFGASNPIGNYLNGAIDEARFSAIEESAGRIKTMYNTMNSPASFYSVGVLQSVVGVNDTAHSTYADNIALTENKTLAVAVAVMSTTSDNVVLVENKTLSLQSAIHGLSSDNLTLTQKHTLAVLDALHGLTADNIDHLDEGLGVVPDDATLGTYADTINLVQKHVLAIQSVIHGLYVDNIDIIQYTLLNKPDDALFGIKSDVIFVIQDHQIDVDSVIMSLKSETFKMINWDELNVYFGSYKKDFKNFGELTPEEAAEKLALKRTYGNNGSFTAVDSDDPGLYKPQYKQTGEF